MSKRTITVQGKKIDFDDFVKYISTQPKLNAIKFLRSKMQLDLGDAKYVVEEIHLGKYDRAYQILNAHNDCSEPILTADGAFDYSNPKQRNPFLIVENNIGNRAKMILIVAIIIMLVSLAVAYLTIQEVGG